MKRIASLLAVAALVAAGLQPAQAGPTPGGMASDNVEWVSAIPFEQSSSTGVTVQGKYMFLTSWKNISIYDISDPVNPVQTATLPVGFMFENEEVSVSPGGKILLFSESLPGNALHIYDVEDKTNIVEFASVPGAGDHTSTCILQCKWAYGSDGSITDLRNPAEPKSIATAGAANDWHKLIGLQGGAHHVREFKNGFVLVSPLDQPPMIVDVRNPVKPKLVAVGDGPIGWSGERGFLWHSGQWPNAGKDRWLLMGGEDVINPPKSTQCDEKQGPFATFDTKGWEKTHSLKMTDTWLATDGSYADGNPAVNPFGCSGHWFTAHPDFDNGGLVAMGWYEHGTRFLQVDSKGKIKEVGWFMPFAGATSSAFWITDEIVYAVDYQRGIDILRYAGK